MIDAQQGKLHRCDRMEIRGRGSLAAMGRQPRQSGRVDFHRAVGERQPPRDDAAPVI